MSAFGKYGTGGSVPGKYKTPSDDNSGNFQQMIAVVGTEMNQPDSAPEVSGNAFGAAEHNPAGAKDMGD